MYRLLVPALIALFVMYALMWMGQIEGFEDQKVAVAEYKQKVMMMFAKYGKGQPIDIAKLDEKTLTEMFKDFLITFNEYQAKINGRPITQADVQKTFPIDFLNEYNASIAAL